MENSLCNAGGLIMQVSDHGRTGDTRLGGCIYPENDASSKAKIDDGCIAGMLHG